MKNVKISGLKTSVSYTGSALTLSDLFNANDKKCKNNGWDGVTLYIVDKKTKKKATLVQDRDFTVFIGERSGIGKIPVTFTGIGGFTGSVTKTVTIKAANVAKDFDVKVADAVYSKAGVKPLVTVTYAGRQLIEGTDYTVSYKNNKKAAAATDKKAPYVVVKAKGNYSGTSKKATYTITKSSVEDLEIQAKDITYKAKGSKGYFLAKPAFIDNGKKVTIGKNKDIKATYTYTYAEDTTLKDGRIKAAGEAVDKKDKLSGPTSIKVTAQIEAGSAKSSYEGSASLEKIYKIVNK